MQTQRFLPLASLVVIIISAWLLISTFVGYGHLVVHVPNDATVLINDHRVPANTSIKLRPGTYHIATLSAQNLSHYDSVTVHTFQTKNYTPQLTKRSLVSIADASVGVSTLSGVALIAYDPHWFGSDWVVMLVGNSTPDVLASHFTGGRWQAAYRTGAGGSVSSLPADIATTVTSMENSINASVQ